MSEDIEEVDKEVTVDIGVTEISAKEIVGTLLALKIVLEHQPIDARYATGKIRGSTNLYYVGTPGDAYLAGKNSALSFLSSFLRNIIEIGKVSKEEVEKITRRIESQYE